jgi:hypothetical protein
MEGRVSTVHLFKCHIQVLLQVTIEILTVLSLINHDNILLHINAIRLLHLLQSYATSVVKEIEESLVSRKMLVTLVPIGWRNLCRAHCSNLNLLDV